MEHIPKKEILVNNLPDGWYNCDKDDGTVTFYRKCEFTVTQTQTQTQTDSDRILFNINTYWDRYIRLQNKREWICCSRTIVYRKRWFYETSNGSKLHRSFKYWIDNYNETILPLNDILDIISHCIVCLGKEVNIESNIGITLGNGHKYYGKKASKCLGYTPTTSRGWLSPKCLYVNISKLKETTTPSNSTTTTPEEDNDDNFEIEVDIIPESILSQYFPDSSDVLSQIILYQSECLCSVKGGKDARSHRWSKQILSLAIS